MEQVQTMQYEQKKQPSSFFQEKGATLITGATGLLGCHIAVELLQKGHRIIVLIRNKGNLSADQRFHSLCDFMGLSNSETSTVRIVEGSLEQQHFGLEKSVYEELCNQTERIIHCAGNTTFSEKKRVESERDNITGLENILDFARNSMSSWFHLISTIYSAGVKAGICEEKINESGMFINVYEELKSQGERMTRKFCSENCIGFTIIRPSIVVGNSCNGRTFRFNGLYYPLKALILIRDIFQHDLLSSQGKRAQQMSISCENGTVNLPLRLEYNPDEGINFVPIDFVVTVINSIIQQPKDGYIYHIAAKNNVTIPDLIDFTHKYFNIKGLTTVNTGFFLKHSKTPLECLFDKYIEPYLPYMKDRRKFSTENTDTLINSRGITCPIFDYVLFCRCMKFALKNNWGKAL